ncbi:MAG: Wzz/FepE/Etk N-terminal domain-containing protein [Candidatus Omnitrophota bacterium]|nr:Wzz/FepE/Etk N-terminal domain-containing protein [Candidatus Omnitrophota bacterium]
MSKDNQQAGEGHGDEIDLGEFLLLLIRKKKVIAAVSGFFLVSALLINFFMPKLYETSATIRIGSINGLLISKAQAIQELQNLKLLNTVIKTLNLDPNLYDLKKILKAEDVTDTNLVRPIVRFDNPKSAKEICNAISENFVLAHNEIYEKEFKLMAKRVGRLEEIERSDKEDSIANKIFDLKEKIIASRNFAVIDPAIIPQRPLGTNNKQNIALALVTGLMVGITWAAFKEFWEKQKYGHNGKIRSF